MSKEISENPLEGYSTPSEFYKANDLVFKGPKEIKNPKKGGKSFTAPDKLAKPSIFNRYSLFFFDNQTSNSIVHENYLDSARRIEDEYLQKIRNEPTAKNLIEWSRNGTNSVEYAWEDFLWCKKYGKVPNNYMVTLRRFTTPPEDDLFDPLKNPNPDIARMITFVDGETNTWSRVGLKWSHKLNYKEFKSEIQKLDATQSQGYGGESNALDGIKGGKQIQAIGSLTNTSQSAAKRGNNPNLNQFDPYQNSSVVFGPIDVIAMTNMRDTGLEFNQDIDLVFEYELRSIDGVNPKVAMMDLLSNVMVCTMNRGAFWGGDIRFYGGNPRRLKPLGDPDKLAKGDYSGYLKSFMSGLSGKLDALSGGKGMSLDGLASAAKTLGSNLMSNITGGALDKMGRPGIQAINSLLSGEPTGEWHLTIGNPANPIISVGNMILTDTEVELYGPLGFDDFPTQVKITCKLKPGRPRDRTEIIGMFSRNVRTYLTTAPEPLTYTGNVRNGGYQKRQAPPGDNINTLKEADFKSTPIEILEKRFPNHSKQIRKNSAEGIY